MPHCHRHASALALRRQRGGRLINTNIDDLYKRWEDAEWSDDDTDGVEDADGIRVKRTPDQKRLDAFRERADYFINEGDVLRLTGTTSLSYTYK